MTNTQRIEDRPPLLLLQAKSIIGAPFTDSVHVAIREGNDLIADFSYRHKVTAETIDLQRLEQTIVNLASSKNTHKSLKKLVKQGFYVCYEDDGWLLKSAPHARIRFMRRSHIIQITICRCGKELVDAMMDDSILRCLLPCRLFAGIFYYPIFVCFFCFFFLCHDLSRTKGTPPQRGSVCV